MKSRYRGGKYHHIFVLMDKAKTGRDSVTEYYCTCESDVRTISCCSHIMTIVWFLGYGQYHGINKPNPDIYNVSISLTRNKIKETKYQYFSVFIVDRFTEQNSTILQTEIETDGDKDRETQTETVRDRQRQIQAKIDRYRNRQNKGWSKPKAEKTEKWTDRLDEDCITLIGLHCNLRY